MALYDDIVALLAKRPRLSASEIARHLGAKGSTKPKRAEVNSELYRHKATLMVDGDAPPRWSLRVDSAAKAPANDVDAPFDARLRRPAAVRGGSAAGEGGRSSVAARPPVKPTFAPRTKAQLIAAICTEVGIADVGIGPGSTEPKAVFTEVIDQLALPIDAVLSKPELAEAICRVVGLPWTSAMDSRSTPSGGGDTVTAPGLRQVLDAVRLIKAGSLTPSATELEHPVVGADPATSFGLVAAGSGMGTAHGGGGEGPVHLALKEFVRDHSEAAIGETLVFLGEDLVEATSQKLGAEISFVTGDRVDLLMQDSEGRFVVIEVEPRIGPSDHIGFHQAAKYWALVAVANGIRLDEVRRLVIATSIDPKLAQHYQSTYGIEPFEVPLSVVEGG